MLEVKTHTYWNRTRAWRPTELQEIKLTKAFVHNTEVYDCQWSVKPRCWCLPSEKSTGLGVISKTPENLRQVPSESRQTAMESFGSLFLGPNFSVRLRVWAPSPVGRDNWGPGTCPWNIEQDRSQVHCLQLKVKERNSRTLVLVDPIIYLARPLRHSWPVHNCCLRGKCLVERAGVSGALSMCGLL